MSSFSRRFLIAGAALLAALACACFDYGGGGGGGGGGSANAAQAFTNNLSIQGATLQQGGMPASDAGPGGPTVIDLSDGGVAEVRVTATDGGSGQTAVTLRVPFSGGPISAVNIGF